MSFLYYLIQKIVLNLFLNAYLFTYITRFFFVDVILELCDGKLEYTLGLTETSQIRLNSWYNVIVSCFAPVKSLLDLIVAILTFLTCL